LGIAIIVIATFVLGRTEAKRTPGKAKSDSSDSHSTNIESTNLERTNLERTNLERTNLERTNLANVQRGLFLMVGVALLWALTPVLDKICLKELPSSQHAFLQCCAIAGVLWVWLLARGESLSLQTVKPFFKWFLLATLAGASALFFQFVATTHVPVGIFEALKRSFGLIAALVLGWFIFGEQVTSKKALILGLMGVGIFIVLT
jgi:uncharacterized membrane protein